MNYDIHPGIKFKNFNITLLGILTDGFLWFKDLSAPDPYGILPLIAGGVSVFNML